MSAGGGAGGGAGGWLVRLDRTGRDSGRFALPRGRATLGRHIDCDVRVLQLAVAPLHADLLVHANQTIIRNLSETGCTLVNGQPVSVAALRHNDVITIGDRQLRWQYAAPPRRQPASSLQPALVVKRGGAGGSGRRKSASAAWRLAFRLPHRASAPDNAGGKQVAIVQPYTNEQNSESTKEINTVRGRGSRGRSSGEPMPPTRVTRSPAVSPSILTSSVLGSPFAQSPTTRQSRTPNASASKRASRASPAIASAKKLSKLSIEPPPAMADTFLSKRTSVVSPASKRQSTRSIEPSPASANASLSKRSSRASAVSPASKRQSTRSTEPSPASANASLSKRSSRASTFSPASKRQSTRSIEPSPAWANASLSKRSSRASAVSPASKRQSTRSTEPSPASANASLSKRSSRASAVSPASKRQSTRSIEPSPASANASLSKRSSRASAVSPASKRQSTRSTEPSPASANASLSKRSSRASAVSPASKRQSTRSTEPSPASANASLSKRSSRASTFSPASKRQSTRSIEPSPAWANASLSKRSSRASAVSPASKRQSTRSTEPSPASANASPSKRSSRASAVSPASKRQSTRSTEPSPASANASPSKRSSRASAGSPASKWQSTPSTEVSPASTNVSLSKRSSRASVVSPASKRQSTRSTESSPVSVNASLSKRSSRAYAVSPTVSPRRPSSRTPVASPQQSTRISELSPVNTSQSKSPTKRQSRADVFASKRQSKSPIERLTQSPVASPVLLSENTSTNWKASKFSTPKTRQSRTMTPLSSLELTTSPKSRKSSCTLTPGSAVSSSAVGRTPGHSSTRVSARTPLRGAPARVSVQSEPRRRTMTATKSTPLRLAVLRRAQSAAKARSGRVTKIQAPTTIDHTKQAALLLMTGRTLSPPVRAATASPAGAGAGARRRAFGRRAGAAGADVSHRQVQVLVANASVRDSPLPATPRKSALKDPSAKKSLRKGDSIKFDLSNLDNHRDSDVFGDSARDSSASEDDVALHYSDTSSASVKSPSPRRPIHSRTSRILENTGVTIDDSFLSHIPSRSTMAAASPRSTRSSRGSAMLQKTLGAPDKHASKHSRRSSRTLTDQSWDTTTASAFRTRTMSPRNQNLESYSIVDLVSVDDPKSSSVYDSVGSTRSSSIVYGTPRGGSRQTRSTIDPMLLTTSTPYVKPAKTRSNSIPNVSTLKSSRNKTSRSSGGSRRSQSLTATPEATQKHISVNSTRISRSSRTKSRMNDSDLQYISPRADTETESPKSSRKSRNSRSLTLNTTLSGADEGIVTPENAPTPGEAGTPVLSIQSLLDSTQSSPASQHSTKRGRPSNNLKRKTIGVLRSVKKGRSSAKSKSLISADRRSPRSRNSPADSDKTDENALRPTADDVTPKSAVKLVPEAVKNKHSTAKKPQSKRSIIDNLNESDVIKQLFNSPVKRKLSRSMTEFSRRHFLDSDDASTRRRTRNGGATTGHTLDSSLLNQSVELSPERFVSPLSTPGNSPNLSGVKRLFRKTAPDNDLTNVEGVKNLLRSPRARKSIRNDLTRVSGVKAVFAKSPRNRLSNVRVKELFAEGPRNELIRVSGVRSLFQEQKNDLTDVRGVKRLFTRRSVANDLENVSGVKKMLRVNSPKNDLRDVSGIEELFNESNNSHPEGNTFDELVGIPQARAVFSKSYVARRTPQTKKGRRAKSWHNISATADNVEQWILHELKTRTDKNTASTSKARKSLSDVPAFNPNVSRELQKLATDTVEGAAALHSLSRTRDRSALKKSAAEMYEARTLPIKKRSVAEASLEKSTRSAVLPIKKRVVVHSTPVKGSHSLTMNASELGRVSPIVLSDNTTVVTAVHGRSRHQSKASPKAASKASPETRTKFKASTLTENVTTQIHTLASPKPRGKNRKVVAQVTVSPKPSRVRRGQLAPTSPKSIPTPKPKKTMRAKTVSENVDVTKPPKIRRTRNNTEKQASVKESPKQKGRRAAQLTIPVKKSPVKKTPVKKMTVKKSPVKKSPVKKITGKKSLVKKSPVKKITGKKIPVKNSPVQIFPKPRSPNEARRVRKTTEELMVETKTKASPKQTRAKANHSPKSPVIAKSTRGTSKKQKKGATNTKKRRSCVVIVKRLSVTTPKRAAQTKKAAANSPVKQATPKKDVSTRRQRAQTEAKATTPLKGRARGTITYGVAIAKPAPIMKPQIKSQDKAQESSGEKGRSSRNAKKVESPKKSPKSTRRAKRTLLPKPPTPKEAKRRRNATEKSLETGSQKNRKTADKSVEEASVRRGRRAANESKVTATAAKRGRKVVEKSVVTEPKAKKNKPSEILDEPPAKRGRKPADKTANVQGSDTHATVEPKKYTRAARGTTKTAQKHKTAVNKSPDIAPTRGRRTRTEDKIEPAPPATRKRKNIDEQPTVPAKIKKTEKALSKEAASPAKKTARGKRERAIAEREQAEPPKRKTRAAAATATGVTSPVAARVGRAASAARRRR